MDNDHKIQISTLRQLLRYDPKSGELFWLRRGKENMPNDSARRTWNTKYAGRPAFAVEQQGYKAGRVLGVSLKAHRIAWALSYGRWPRGEIDHINGDRADNKLSNLREVSRLENRKNLKRQSNNSSGMTGVSGRGDRGFQAYIKVKGKQMHLGYFNRLEDACAARLEAERVYGFHQNHGRLA